MTLFLGLLDKNTPMKRISREMKMSSEDITHHIYYLRYYRRFVEVANELKTLSLGRSEFTTEQSKRWVSKKKDLRRGLKKLYKECNDEVQRIKNKLGR